MQKYIPPLELRFPDDPRVPSNDKPPTPHEQQPPTTVDAEKDATSERITSVLPSKDLSPSTDPISSRLFEEKKISPPIPPLHESTRSIGESIRNLSYEDYQALAKKLLELYRIAGREKKDEEKKTAPTRVDNELVNFLETHQSTTLQSLAELIRARTQILPIQIINKKEPETPKDFMKNMIDIVRHYYLRGTNIINPNNEKDRIKGLPLSRGVIYVIKLPHSELFQEQPKQIEIFIDKTGEIIAQDNTTGMKKPLQRNIVYIAGRILGKTKLGHSGLSFSQIWPETEAQELQGFAIGVKISSKGIGIEIKGEHLYIYDRVSLTSFSCKALSQPSTNI